MRLNCKRLLTVFMFLSTYFMFSQNLKSIEGAVTDTKGVALPGVNVIIKESALGTVTDFEGNYTIKVDQTSILVFSYLGFETQEVLASNQQTINVQMTEDTESLSEIVVTALGITRDKKSLGYATQEVKGEELAAVKSGNFTNAISGKASGVQIKRNNNLGGSTNVVIRGNSSINGNNQALFVIDGVPINNYNSNSATQQQGGGASYDYGNTASDINPEDIESINILKGAAASALYGSRAANGVIIIETKKGKNKKGMGVTLNSGVTIGSIDKSTFAKYQTEYGAGYGQFYDGPGGRFYEEDVTGDGVNDLVSLYTEDASYGAQFDSDLLVYQWDSFDPGLSNYQTATPWENAKNGPITFFETPITITNSVSIEDASEKGSFRISYTNFDQKGILPNSSIKKNNFALRGTAKVTEKLTASGMANYIKTEGLGRNSTGYNDNIISNFKQWWQTNVDIADLKNAYFSTGRNVTWNPATSEAGSSPIFWDNPYWTRYENFQNDARHRFIGNMSLNYEITNWLNVTGRVATDTYSEIQEERRANGSIATAFGVNRTNVSSGYLRRNIQNIETNYDLMFNFDKDLTQELNLKGVIGSNIRRNSLESITSSTAGGLIIENLYSLQNSVDELSLPVELDEKVGVDGVYASASLGYKDTYFLDGTLRRDISSTLPVNNNTYYYPSVAGSFVFSNLIESNVISFGKIRANYAQVGNDASFDNLFDSYDINSSIGAASTSVKSVRNNPELKPEETTSVELGLELKLLQNRLGFDVALYKTNSVDQIFEVPLSRSSGYTSTLLNAGEIENKGIEFSVYGSPIKTKNFNWKMNVNWTKNVNEVVSLTDGIENLTLGSFQGGVTINARAGEAYGVIAGTDYTYLDGQRVVDASTGQYISTSTSDNVIGDTNPEWQMGLSNKFSYKNVSLSFLIDIQKGGDIFSLDQYYGLATGLYEETVFTNDLGNPVRNTLAEGGGFVNVGVNADGSTNTTRIQASDFGALGYRRGLPNRAFVYDASYVKLREVVLTYDFPKSIFDANFLEGASLSFIGSNLWIIHKNLPHEDPESGLSSGNIQGYSVGATPTTRDYGFNLKLQF